MQTLNLIGAGRVGQTLATLWHRHGVFAVQQVLTRSEASARAACAAIGAGTPVPQMAQLRPADVWILAVPDAQIAAVAQALAAHTPHWHASRNGLAANADGGADADANGKAGSPIVFHCSGAHSASLLAPLTAQGWRGASAHCILSFASVEVAMQQFPGTACALEGDALAIAALRSAFTAIQAQCFEVQSDHKLLYHAAAVFATNFLPVIQSVAEDAWRASGVPAALLPGLRERLLHNAVANITRLGPAGALTGPAARGDVAAIARQAEAVAQWDAQAGAAYTALSALALRLAKASSDSSPTAASAY